MKYAAFPLPPLLDSDNPVRCRCHKLLTEMMIIYERLIETLQLEDIKRPPKPKKRKKRVVGKIVKMGRPSRYTKDMTKP